VSEAAAAVAAMSENGAMHADRRRAAALAGHAGDQATARALLRDPSDRTRATALGALARIGAATEADVAVALADASPAVRRRACQVAVGVPGADPRAALGDPDPGVAETAAWALGERGVAGTDGEVVTALAEMATGHDDPLCREAAVAALGAIGDERGLPAVLAATRDRPAIRRRAVIALAPFSGPDVDAALATALTDRDWQVRQAAEDLTDTG
jgi:HEAT repeat protein